MTIFALLGWQLLGMVLGGAMAAIWKVPGLTLAWGIVSGGVGGFVGGLLSRMLLPGGTLFDGLSVAFAAVGAVLAMLIARDGVANGRPGTA